MWRRSAAARPLAALLARRAHPHPLRVASVRPLSAVQWCGAHGSLSCLSRGLATSGSVADASGLSSVVADFANNSHGVVAPGTTPATREEMATLALAKQRQAVAAGLAAAAAGATGAGVGSSTPSRSLSESVGGSVDSGGADEPDPTVAVSLSPCHPSSLLSLPLYNMLRSDVHTRAFLKMAVRASVAPKSTAQRRTWLPVAEWDLADHLAVPPNRSHPNWTAFQNAMASNASVQLASAKRAAEEAEAAAIARGEDPVAAAAAQAAAAEAEPVRNEEPFTPDQIESNLADFLLSPTLHQCQLLVDTVAQTQGEFMRVHAEVEEERLATLAQLQERGAGGVMSDELLLQIKAWKGRLQAAWEPRNAAVLVVMVDQFIAFMDEPVGDLPAGSDADPSDVNSVLASFRPKHEKADPSVKDQLLKTRSGRLRFDPSLADLANFSAPHEWYPLARSLPRKFIVHVGPTNSGKCWGAGTGMLMYDGTTKCVEHVRAGDVLAGDDSLPRVVEAGSVIRGHTGADETRWIAEGGERLDPLRRPGTFQVRLHNAARQTWTCNADHILVLKFNRPPTRVQHAPEVEAEAEAPDAQVDQTRPYYFSSLQVQGEAVVDVAHRYATEAEAESSRVALLRSWRPLVWECSVHQYLSCGAEVRSLARMWSPDEGVSFAPAQRPLRERLEQHLGHAVDEETVRRTAWMVGVWLAKGKVGSASILQQQQQGHSLTNALEQWLAAVGPTGAESGVIPGADAVDVPVSVRDEVDMGPVLLALLDSYKLLECKHVPTELVRESIEVRRHILAGIIDGGASFNDNASTADDGSMQLESPDMECMTGFEQLCRSVGLATGPISVDVSSDDCNDLAGSVCRMAIRGGRLDALVPLVRCEQGLKTLADRDQVDSAAADDLCDAFTLTRVAHAPYFGFTLAGPNGRCLLSDFTVTHNTYHAMQRLMEAKSGLYCGPLRLLAWEVKDKMSKRGVPCNLLTGQEKDEVPGACHTSSTVEMANIDTIIDVAVVDEVQMLAASDRGSAWTRALLGIPAYEIHVCGDPSMVEIVEELCAITGEPVEVREYQRLTPLVVAPPLLNGVRDVRKGDCIVAFSRLQLYRLKREVEQQLALKCCIIYGSLPPEARRQQAGLFNDPNSGYDVLLASDAIGMGLNLNIARVVFAKMEKFDGKAMRPLTPSETLQIAGRAGRFNTSVASGSGAASKIRTLEEASASNRGEVTTMQADEHAYLQWAMKQSLAPIDRVGLAPTYEQLELLHQLRPKETLSNLLTYFGQYAKLDSLYFTVDMEGMKQIAEALEHIEFKSMRERWVFCQAPARMDSPHVANAMRIYAKLFVAGEAVPANAIRIPQLRTPTNDVNMNLMETFYQVLDLYVWLGLKFGVAQFVDLDKAQIIRDTVARVVQAGIENLAPTSAWMQRRRQDIVRQQQRQERLLRKDVTTAHHDSEPPAPVVHTSNHPPAQHAQRQQQRPRHQSQHSSPNQHAPPHVGSSGRKTVSRAAAVAREIEQRVLRAEADAHHAQFKGARKDRPASAEQMRRRSASKAKGIHNEQKRARRDNQDTD